MSGFALLAVLSASLWHILLCFPFCLTPEKDGKVPSCGIENLCARPLPSLPYWYMSSTMFKKKIFLMPLVHFTHSRWMILTVEHSWNLHKKKTPTKQKTNNNNKNPQAVSTWFDFFICSFFFFLCMILLFPFPSVHLSLLLKTQYPSCRWKDNMF